MEPNQERSLIPRPSHELIVPRVAGNRILAGMVEETLALGREDAGAQTAKFRIGEFELCEPDYRQVLIWAKVWNLPPERVIGGLLHSWEEKWVPEWSEPRLANGRLLNVNWGFNVIPTRSFEWVDQLAITHLTFWPLCLDAKGLELCLRLRALTHLSCIGLGAARIDLSGVPMLMELLCEQNFLTKLDLSAVPLLRKLNCSWNQLTELDLSRVPMLTYLSCSGKTHLTRLDLSCVPMLETLDCGLGKFTELDLSRVPMLRHLFCEYNPLTHLELSSAPRLEELFCCSCAFKELDVSSLPLLKRLNCGENLLADLDISKVPELTELSCEKNWLSQLDLSSVPMLEVLSCEENELTTLDIRPLPKLKSLKYDVGKTRLIQRPDQNF